MIDEHRQDLAAEYALDALDPESARAFEAMLANDAELKALADNLRETAATLALDAPPLRPPPELRERVLSSIRAEAEATTPGTTAPVASTVVAPVRASEGSNILPWALAAGFALTTAALWTERSQLQKDRVDLLHEISEAHNRDPFAKLKIATLSAQVEAYAKSSAVVLWDPQQQRGLIKLANVPRPDAGKDYQLWVIDPKYPQPVSSGLVHVDAEGTARVSFEPNKPISRANAFAISVEPEGGVPVKTGPVILVGAN